MKISNFFESGGISEPGAGFLGLQHLKYDLAVRFYRLRI